MPIRSTEGWVRLRLSQAPDGIQGFCACLKFKAVEKSAFLGGGTEPRLCCLLSLWLQFPPLITFVKSQVIKTLGTRVSLS